MGAPQALESDKPECESLLCHLLAVWPWTSHSPSLIWSFSIKLRSSPSPWGFHKD